ncbi:MAG: ShlB/FhaC/HecB family hemolysin secretion/activation protein [Gammaproteobacteria bacterium]|nr:ShlB/FhaC/HecB family hemolysin secretion/activation protein [Gammaproteobacteria bacterium]
MLTRVGLGLAATVMVCAAPTVIWAQARPADVDAGSILRQEEALQQPEPAPLVAPDEQAPLPELTGIGDVTVEVTEVEFTGATDLVESAGLEAVVAEAIGRELDFAGLQALAERVTRHLKEEGWVLARAFLPEQDVTNGIITIEIIPGRLDIQGRAFRIEPVGSRPLRIDPERLGAILTALIPAGEPIRQADLDRAILLINDLPGIDALARLEPGEAEGSSHILLSVREGPLFAAGLNASNFGSRSTGRERAGFTGNLNNFTGVGDQATLAVTAAEGLALGQLNYKYPLGPSGLTADFSLSQMDYDVINLDSSSELDGSSTSTGVALSYPLIRSQQTNVNFGLEWTWEDLEDRIDDVAYSDKQVSFGGLSLSADHTDRFFGPAGRTNVSLSPIWGSLDLPALVNNQPQGDELGTEGSFSKIEYSLSRLQSLGGRPITLYTELRGQWAQENLDSSQSFQPGGSSGVRAYPGGEASADQGHLLRAELRYQLPDDLIDLGSVRLSAFYDSAWVRVNKNIPDGFELDTATGDNTYQIDGAGIGLRLTRDDWLTVSLTLATTIGDNPGRDINGNNSDGRADEQRAWLQAVVRL